MLTIISTGPVCNFNRHYAEYAGYWRTTDFLKEADRTNPITFYDSVTGKPLFIAPKVKSLALSVRRCGTAAAQPTLCG